MTSRRSQRRYYDRILNSYPADDTPFKKSAKHPKKDPYLSKPFRQYQYYLTQRFGNILAMSVAEHLHSAMNRDGFMRRFLTPAAERKPAMQSPSATKYQAYQKEVLPRSRYLAYTVPYNWLTWEEEEQIEGLLPSAEVALGAFGEPSTKPLVVSDARRTRHEDGKNLLNLSYKEPTNVPDARAIDRLRKIIATMPADPFAAHRAKAQEELRNTTPLPAEITLMPIDTTTGEYAAFQKLMDAKVKKVLGVPNGFGPYTISRKEPDES